ncbi:asparagine synthase (glutamine-hydrolyzing) [Candidatus Magnetomonas plexicatena]|uniref:asparagine synthase (glutamine-hydrolyzing) n=1 Tax=Candidatus Magnetomonas plexicatena TaxID=2552947 RepID=UPI001C750C6B|nr:asparagine synthase (glutamine-hydrolyzing) [Nitrospirales bacterium LBB_01]
MCGIAGMVSFKGAWVNTERLKRACEQLSERGPDDAGIWTEGHTGLAHRRLSVIDITSEGHQPMASHCGRFVIVYNGEIYNFQELRAALETEFNITWKGGSDTEVLLEAYRIWGAYCLNRLRGMFSFAIWDRHEKTLFAARDRMGEKPFYYHYDGGLFAFASRSKAIYELLQGLSRDIDMQGLRYYIEIGYFPAPLTIYEKIKKLPQGHYLIVNTDGVTVKRYYDFRQRVPDRSLKHTKENDLLDELDEILLRAVKLQMISDVPLGAFLSGGIDSSLVVAMMRKLSTGSVKTFTIGFKEAQYDESTHALRVSRHLDTDHHQQIMSVNDLLNLIPRFTEAFDKPFFDYSALPSMAVSELARGFVTVVLTGDGGDELFGGYHYYVLLKRLEALFKIPAAFRKLASNILSMVPSHKGKLLSQMLTKSDAISAFAFTRSIIKDFSSIMLPDLTSCTVGIADCFTTAAREFPKSLTATEAAMRLDTLFTLPDDYLQKVDVSSMAYSLEARAPLLDPDVVSFAMRLPETWKVRGLTNKYLLRKLAYRYIPREILDRPKQGFSVPVAIWLRGGLKDWAMERFNDKESLRALYLNHNEILKLYDLHLSGKRNAASILWAVAVLVDFYRRDQLR